MLLLLLVALSTGTLVTSDTPQISNSPASVIEGDEMTLSCKRRHNLVTATPDVQFAIYRNEKRVQEFGPSATYTVLSAQLEDYGNYSCEVRNSTGSVRKTRAVSIQIEDLFSTPEIRNNQSSVTECDEMTLTCDIRRNPARSTTELEFAFYRDGWNEQDFSASATYSVPLGQLVHFGNYTCDVRTPSGNVRKRSDGLYIQIEALFDTPVIRNNHSAVTEGDEMTLTCDTRRNPVTATTELEFAFYRSLWIVQKFSASDTYSVPSAQLWHSGNYSCDVRTTSGRVRKGSHVLSIHIEALFDSPVIRNNQSSVTEGDEMTLICAVRRNPATATKELQFAFYRFTVNVQRFNASDTYTVQSAQLEDSGNYTCDVRTPSGSMIKMSKALSVEIEALFGYPSIIINPSSVTEGENVTLTCNTTRNPALSTMELEFAFHKEFYVQNFSASDTYILPSAAAEDSGIYTCFVRTPNNRVMKRSAPVIIHIQALFGTPQIRHNQPSVTEGDELTLTCRVTSYWGARGRESALHRDEMDFRGYDSYNGPLAQLMDFGDEGAPSGRVRNTLNTTELEFAFYMYEQKVQEFSASDTYSVPSAQPVHSGYYTCEVRTPSGRVRKRSDDFYIRIEALFHAPRIINKRSPVIEGDEMTLTCDVTRNPSRAATELQFAFYRSGQDEQEFSVFDTYRVWSAQLVHSGYYTCEVRTPSGRVRKGSNVLPVQIQVIFDDPQILNSRSPVTEGEEMILTCHIRRYCVRSSTEPEFAFYRDGWGVQNFSASDTYSVPSAQPEHAGNYTCEVMTPSGRVWKESDALSIQIEEKGPPLPILLGAIYGSLAVIALICVLLAWKCRTKRAARNTTAACTSKDDNSPATHAEVEPTET